MPTDLTPPMMLGPGDAQVQRSIQLEMDDPTDAEYRMFTILGEAMVVADHPAWTTRLVDELRSNPYGVRAFWGICLGIAKQLSIRDVSSGDKMSRLVDFVHELVRTSEWNYWEAPVSIPSVSEMFSRDWDIHHGPESEERTFNLLAFLAHLGFKGILSARTDDLMLPCMNLVLSEIPRAAIHDPSEPVQPCHARSSSDRLGFAADAAALEAYAKWETKFLLGALWIHAFGKRFFTKFVVNPHEQPAATELPWIPAPLANRPQQEASYAWGYWRAVCHIYSLSLVDRETRRQAGDAYAYMCMIDEAWMNEGGGHGAMAPLPTTWDEDLANLVFSLRI